MYCGEAYKECKWATVTRQKRTPAVAVQTKRCLIIVLAGLKCYFGHGYGNFSLWGHLKDSYFGLPDFFVFAVPRKSPKIERWLILMWNLGRKSLKCASFAMSGRGRHQLLNDLSDQLTFECTVSFVAFTGMSDSCWFNVKQAHKWHCTSEFQMLVTWKDSCMRSAVWIGQIACLRYTIPQRFNILHYRMSPGCAAVASTSACEMHIL